MTDVTRPADDEPADDLRGRTRAADPASGLPAADPDEVDRLIARVRDSDLRETGTRRRNALTWLVAAAAIVVIGAGAGWWISQRGGDEPDVIASAQGSTAPPRATELVVEQAGTTRCMMPSVELLADRPTAFAGTVLGIADGVATVRPTKVYTGQVGDEVSLTGAVAAGAGPSVEGDPEVEVGGRYLFAVEEGRVLGCGLSGPASPSLQALYDRAFTR